MSDTPAQDAADAKAVSDAREATATKTADAEAKKVADDKAKALYRQMAQDLAFDPRQETEVVR